MGESSTHLREYVAEEVVQRMRECVHPLLLEEGREVLVELGVLDVWNCYD